MNLVWTNRSPDFGWGEYVHISNIYELIDDGLMHCWILMCLYLFVYQC